MFIVRPATVTAFTAATLPPPPPLFFRTSLLISSFFSDVLFLLIHYHDVLLKDYSFFLFKMHSFSTNINPVAHYSGTFCMK